MTEIYLIRHAQAEGNRFRIMQGHWDGGVTALGRRQIALLSDRLRDLRFDAVCSSDLYRAMLTASAVYRPRSLPLFTTPALRELNIGPWEQLFFGNLLHEEPELAQRFLTDPASWRLEGAETFAELTDRAYPALEAIARRYEGGRVAVVSHGVTIRCLLSRITGIDLRDREKLPMLLNTAVSVLRWEKGAFSLELFNDDSHLDALPRRNWGSTATLRHRPLDPRTERDYYCACYRDAWLAAHGDLRGFYPEPYWKAAREHLRLDPDSVLVLLDGDKPVGLVESEKTAVIAACLRGGLRLAEPAVSHSGIPGQGLRHPGPGPGRGGLPHPGPPGPAPPGGGGQRRGLRLLPAGGLLLRGRGGGQPRPAPAAGAVSYGKAG